MAILLSLTALVLLCLTNGTHGTRDGNHAAFLRRRLQEMQEQVDVPWADRQALLRLFNATWPWNISQPWSQGGPVCSWPGVSCCMAVPLTIGQPGDLTTGYYLVYRRAAGGLKASLEVEPCLHPGRVAGLSLSGRRLSGRLPLDALGALDALQHLDFSHNPGLTGGGSRLVELLLQLQSAYVQNTSLTCFDPSAGKDWLATQQSISPPSWCTPPDGRIAYAWQTLDIEGGGAKCAQATSTQLPSPITGLPVSTILMTDPEFWLYAYCSCAQSSNAPAMQLYVERLPTEQTWHASCRELQAIGNNTRHASSSQIGIVIGATAGGCVACFVIAAFNWSRRSRASSETHEDFNEPPGTRPDLYPHGVTLSATDVEGSTELWEWNPEVMNEALLLHDTLMRATIAACGGYEVTTEGDAFLVAWHTPVAAVRWCLTVQQGLLELAWPQKLLEHSLCMPRPLLLTSPKAGQTGTSTEAVPPVLFKGLNVRMGVASGQPSSVQPHATTGRMQYNGLVLRLATAVADMALGGQILLDPCTFRLLHGSLDKVHVQPIEYELITNHINTTMAEMKQHLSRNETDGDQLNHSGSINVAAMKNSFSMLQSAFDKDDFSMHMYRGAKRTSAMVKRRSTSSRKSKELGKASREIVRVSKELRRSKDIKSSLEGVMVSSSSRAGNSGAHVHSVKSLVENAFLDANASRSFQFKDDSTRQHSEATCGDFLTSGDDNMVSHFEELNTTTHDPMSSVMALFNRTVNEAAFSNHKTPGRGNAATNRITSGSHPDGQPQLAAHAAAAQNGVENPGQKVMHPSRMSLEVGAHMARSRSFRQSRFNQLRVSFDQHDAHYQGLQSTQTDPGGMPVIISCNNVIDEDADAGQSSTGHAAQHALSENSMATSRTASKVLSRASSWVARTIHSRSSSSTAAGLDTAPLEATDEGDPQSLGSSSQPKATWVLGQLYAPSKAHMPSCPAGLAAAAEPVSVLCKLSVQDGLTKEIGASSSAGFVESLDVFAAKVVAGSSGRFELQQPSTDVSEVVPRFASAVAWQAAGSSYAAAQPPEQLDAVAAAGPPGPGIHRYAILEGHARLLDSDEIPGASESTQANALMLAWPQTLEMRSAASCTQQSGFSAQLRSAGLASSKQGSMIKWLDTASRSMGQGSNAASSTVPSLCPVQEAIRVTPRQVDPDLMNVLPILESEARLMESGTLDEDRLGSVKGHGMPPGGGEHQAQPSDTPDTAVEIRVDPELQQNEVDSEVVQKLRERRRSIHWHDAPTANGASLLKRLAWKLGKQRGRQRSAQRRSTDGHYGSFSGLRLSQSFRVAPRVASQAVNQRLQCVLVIDMGVHLIKSLGPALPQDLVHGLQVVQILPEALSARANYLNHVQSKKMIAPSFFDAPGANLALAPRAAGNPSVKLPPVVMMFISAEHLGSVADCTDQLVYDQSLALFCHTVRSVLQEFQLYECQEFQGTLMVAASLPGVAAKAALLLQLKLLVADWPDALLNTSIGAEVKDEDTGTVLFRGLRAKIGIYMDTPLSIVPHTTTGRADYFGTLVNRAARYMAGAAGGQILTDQHAALAAVAEWRQAEPHTSNVDSASLDNTAVTSRPAGPGQKLNSNDSMPRYKTARGSSEWLIDTRDTSQGVGHVSSPLSTPASQPLLLTSYPANILKEVATMANYAQVCLEPGAPQTPGSTETVSSKFIHPTFNESLIKKPSGLSAASRRTSSACGANTTDMQVRLLDLGVYEFKGLPVAQKVMGFELASLAARSKLLPGKPMSRGKAKCVRMGSGLLETVAVQIPI